MAVKNYLCKKCKVLIQKSGSPSVYDCPSGGSHDWSDLGEVGSDIYLCKKCVKVVNSKSSPSPYDCPSGGNHDWKKL